MASWKKRINQLTNIYNLNEGESKRLKGSPVARFINALPKLAGCHNADRTALNNLGVYVTASRNRQGFNQLAGETISTRLFDISHFQGGSRVQFSRQTTLS